MKIKFIPLFLIVSSAGMLPTISMAQNAPTGQSAPTGTQSAPTGNISANLQASDPANQIPPQNEPPQPKQSKTNTQNVDVSATEVAPVPPAPEHKLTGKDIYGLIAQSHDYLPFDIDVPGQSFVSTGPYVGVPIQFAGSNLVINSPSVNTDVQLLSIRKKIHDQLMAMGGTLFKEPYHSHLLLSGIVEAQANYTHFNGGESTSYIDVTNFSFDAFFIGPSQWSLGFVELTYDNLPPFLSPYGSTFQSAYTDINSRVFVNKAFITIGNFDKSPIYGSIGQYYVPFGTYSSSLVSSPYTKIFARTKARALTLGFYQQETNALYGSAFVFRGDSTPGPENQINNGGVNLGFNFSCGMFSGTIGGGVIGNITDSAGMQYLGGFQTYEKIEHRVPAYDFNANISLGSSVDLIIEYISASTRYNPEDFSYNGHGAKPWALDVELSYSFSAWGRPNSIGVAYDQSGQLLAMGLPRKSYFVVFNTSIWRNTLQSIEFRHDEPYSKHAFANGPVNGLPIVPNDDPTVPVCTAATCTSNGRPDNSVTLQFDYYF